MRARASSLSLSTLADQVGACAMLLRPLYELIRAHVLRRRAHAWRRHHGAGAGQGTDAHRPVMDLCARRPPVRRPCAAGRGVLLLARSHRRASRAASGRLCRDPAGRRLCGLQRALRMPTDRAGPITEAACWAHARRKFFVLADITAKARGKLAVIAPLAFEAVKRIDAIFDVEREINGLLRRRAPRGAPRPRRAARRRSGGLDAERARQALAPHRGRQGDGLHAQALGQPSRASSTTAASA